MAKAKGEGTKIWSAFSLGAAIVSAGLARKAIDKSWKISTGKTPPENPADPDVDVWEAVAWATVTGAAVALAKMYAQRRAAHYYLKSTGELPLPLRKDSA